jgi:hypothetical protein
MHAYNTCACESYSLQVHMVCKSPHRLVTEIIGPLKNCRGKGQRMQQVDHQD